MLSSILLIVVYVLKVDEVAIEYLKFILIVNEFLACLKFLQVILSLLCIADSWVNL